MVQAAVVIGLRKFLPVTVHVLAHRLPFLVLLPETIDHQRNGDRGILDHQIQHFLSGVAVNSCDGVPVNDAQNVLVERVLESLASHPLFGVGGLRGRHGFLQHKFGLGKLRNFFRDRFETHQRAGVAVDHHVDFEPLILAAEQRFLVRVAAHVSEGVAFFAADWERHPSIVEHLGIVICPAAAWWRWVIAREGTVRRGATTASREVNFRQRNRVPRVLRDGRVLDLSVPVDERRTLPGR
mmetsp:Transcript_28971/g.81594  ORF Transcript_28971/g.81594 Transcript_28971/m.81594 type:complete len:239 (-) Transcript_28971:2346-3062(-)